MSNRLLLLVDGLAVAYRAFHAIPALTAPDGHPTNALFGFAKMLRQLQDAWNPSHLAVVFDGGLPAARLELLPAYKAQREEMPADLARQLPALNEYLESLRVVAVRLPGEEADDAMATLAAQAREAGLPTLMATSDKDMLQCVDDAVGVVPPVKDARRLGPAEVREKTGVAPGQVAAWLALTGDTADNIPGVPGVGPKTAAKLLQEFGTLEELWRRLEEVKSERTRLLLAQHREAVTRNLSLVTLRCDVAGLPGLEELQVRAPDLARLLPLLQRFGLSSLGRAYQEGELNLL
jgi:5'-3' exonuclease